jgi:adenylate cyclase class 2
MSLEIEAKFLDVNINKLRKLLKANNAKKVHKMVMYKRYVFHLLSKEEKGYIRTRQEYNKVTITIKKYPKDSKFATEDEIEVNSSFEDTKKFLLAQGFKVKTYQETLREKWSLDELEIAIDTIPGIPTYVELECKSHCIGVADGKISNKFLQCGESEIKKVAKLLELDYSKAEYGPYDKQFVDYYGVDKNNINNVISSLTFSNIDKELQPHIKKNKDMLVRVKNDQLKIIKTNKIK